MEDGGFDVGAVVGEGEEVGLEEGEEGVHCGGVEWSAGELMAGMGLGGVWIWCW